MPIVHRDISAGNILVYCRDSDRIIIKFADFGLAKKGHYLKTLCGNLTYLAPEIFADIIQPVEYRSGDEYTESVDIWSSATVVAELLCGLPECFKLYKDTDNLTWHEKIRKRLRDHYAKTRDPLALFLLSSMLTIKPEHRALAAECHREALRLPDGSKDRRECLGSHSIAENEIGESTFCLPVESDKQKTVIFRSPDIDDTLFSLDDASLDKYIIGLKKLGTPPAESIAVQKNRARVKHLLDKITDPEHYLFPGFLSDGLFDSKKGGGALLDVLGQREQQVDDELDPRADSERETVVDETSPATGGPAESLSILARHGDEGTRSNIFSNLLAPSDLMRGWSELGSEQGGRAGRRAHQYHRTEPDMECSGTW